MKTRITDVNGEADQLIPPTEPDGSGIGVNYVDAFIKPMNIQLDDGKKITCKRKGLKILLSIGEQQGEALMRRIEHGPDVKAILRHALETAAIEAGSSFSVEDNGIYLDV